MSIFRRKKRSDLLWEQYIRLRDMAGATIPGTEDYEQVTEAMRKIIKEYIFETTWEYISNEN